MVFFDLSLAAFFTPLAALAIHGLPAARLIRAAEELTLLRTVAGAFGIALQGVVVFRRTTFHHLDLFGVRRFASLDLLSQFSDRLQASGFSANMARSQMGLLIREQATLLGMRFFSAPSLSSRSPPSSGSLNRLSGANECLAVGRVVAAVRQPGARPRHGARLAG
jgi:hypothetical protein